MSKNELDIQEFAQRVERLCDFILTQIDKENKDGSVDLVFIHNLKDDASDIQFNKVKTSPLSSISLVGVDDYTRGILKPE